MSEIVKVLMRQWHPDTCNAELEEEFGSCDGPWDVFKVFKFLQQPDTFKKMQLSFGCDQPTPEQDSMRQKLEGILQSILSVRNWWAHVQVRGGNVKETLMNFRDLISMVIELPLASQIPGCGPFRDQLNSMLAESVDALKIDDVSYFLFVQASRYLSELANRIMKHRPLLPFSAFLKLQIDKKDVHYRQKHVVEVTDVTRALDALKESKEHDPVTIDGCFQDFDFVFECKTIGIVRNSFAHFTCSDNNVTVVVLALGSLSRVVSILSHMCSPAAAPHDATLQSILHDAAKMRQDIDDWQAVLLQKTGMADADFLIEAVCQSYSKQLGGCNYADLATDNYRRLRLLTLNEVTGCKPAPHVDDKFIAGISKDLRTVLEFVSLVPVRFRESACCAMTWLLQFVCNDSGTKSQIWLLEYVHWFLLKKPDLMQTKADVQQVFISRLKAMISCISDEFTK
jgi:hypothetical protein